MRGGSEIDVAESGEVMPGVCLCDATCFPNLPALSLTFTIIANVYHTALQATSLSATPRPTQVAANP